MKLKEYIKQAQPNQIFSYFRYRFFDDEYYSNVYSSYYSTLDLSGLGNYEIVGEPKFYGTMQPLFFTLYGRIKHNDYSRMVQ